MNAVEIDAFEFSRQKDRRDGETAVASLARLANDCADPSGALQWVVTGGVHTSGYPQLLLSVTGDVHLVCQRCLKTYTHAIDSRATLVLARSDLQADQIEVTLDDDSLDVVVVAPSMNLLELVEDEALLSIPQAPKHEQCPESATTADLESKLAKSSVTGESIAASSIKDSSPFAQLKDLRH